ncbi:ABC transporter permease subunit [Agrococcus sp. ARC_14]|uniref:ABC transporter permease subunit n=1 Tax=Agrococcus sp. ARC_14 TaxID=2919927 RepID=UPI001F059E2C|nr:ABC transporter permease subunit [Agrococcus sp. ARC_14]
MSTTEELAATQTPGRRHADRQARARRESSAPGKRPRRSRRLRSQIIPWLIPVIALLVWQLSPGEFLPSPVEVIDAAVRLTANGELQEHVWISTRRALIGFAIGGIIGFALGLLNGVSKRLSELLDTSIQMIRTVPHLALIPLVIVWFGLGEDGKIFLVALGVAFPIYLNAYNGIRNIDPRLIEMARVYRLSKTALFKEVIIPGAMPSILVGVRYALGIMWMSLIVAETIGSNGGIGHLATQARQFVQMDVVVLTIVIYALLGKFSDVIAAFLERRWLRWNPAFNANPTGA